ncbi:MAG: hypothetical protein JWP81_775 [Ferruginibacter sp.]|nr:hypothetical protein [Ferruginibacter sp.]
MKFNLGSQKFTLSMPALRFLLILPATIDKTAEQLLLCYCLANAKKNLPAEFNFNY